MKKALYAFVALIVIVVLAALVGPRFVDWEDYKADIARELETASGRRIAIDGDVSLQLLPAPSLRANGVRIANVKGGAAPELATVGTLKMDLAFWPLLRGRIVGTGVVLVKPKISLEISADGKPNWLLRGAPSSFGRRQLIDDLTVRGGTIRYRNRALGQDFTVVGSDLSVSGGEVSGPHLIKGTVRFGRSKISARGSFTRRPNKLYGVLLDLNHLDSRTRLRYQGVASLGDKGPRLSGKIALSSDRPNQFVRAFATDPRLAKKTARWLKDKIAVSADLTVVGTEASVGGLKIALGKIEASGQLDASLTAKPRYRVALAFNRLDLDKVIERLRGVGSLTVPGAAPSGKALAPVLTVEIKVNALIFRDEIIRDLHLRGRLANGGAQLHALTAQLPGAAELTLTGGNGRAASGRRFDGRFGLSAGNLRGTLDWLGLDTSRVPAARLRRANATGRLVMTAQGLELLETRLDVDTSQIKGRWGLRFASRPRFNADITIDRLDIGAYLPRERPKPDPKAGPSTAPPPSKPKPKTGAVPKGQKPAPALLLAGLDGKFAVRIRQLTYAGQTASAAFVKGKYERTVLGLDRASVTDLGGVSGQLSGTIGGTEKNPKVDLKFEGRASRLSNALRLLDMTGPAVLDRLGEIRAKGAVSGGKALAHLKAAIAVADGEAQLDGQFVPKLLQARYKFKFSLQHPRAEMVLARLGVSGAAADRRLGSVRMSGTANGTLAKASLPKLKLSIGDVAMTAALDVDIARVRPRITGEIRTGDITVAQLLAAPVLLIASGPGAGDGLRWTGGLPKAPLDLDGLKAIDAQLLVRPAGVTVGPHKVSDPLVEVTLVDGKLDLKRATGRMFGGALSIQAKLRSGKMTLVDAAFALRGANLQEASKLFPGAAFKGGKLTLDATLKAKGTSIHGLVAGLGGNVSLKVRRGEVAGFDLASINRRIAGQTDAIALISLLTEGMSTGSTRFKELNGQVKIVGGVGQVDNLRLLADGGSAKGKGQIALIKGKLKGAAEFRFTAIEKAPPLKVAISGQLGDLKAVFRFNALQRHLLARKRKITP